MSEGKRGWSVGLGRLLALLVGAALVTGCSSATLTTGTPAEPITPPSAPPAVTPEAPIPTSPATPEPTVAPTQEPTPEPTAPPARPATAAQGPNAAAYRIEIARLGINLPIAEGDLARDVETAHTPENWAFHLPGTSMFGPGNTYIYAHARVGMFLSLWNVRIGDLVVVSTPNGAREYRVEEIHPRVPWTEVSWAGPTADTRLTLQTSTGPNGTDPRFVVIARPR